jgi:hypothetical protein
METLRTVATHWPLKQAKPGGTLTRSQTATAGDGGKFVGGDAGAAIEDVGVDCEEGVKETVGTSEGLTLEDEEVGEIGVGETEVGTGSRVGFNVGEGIWEAGEGTTAGENVGMGSGVGINIGDGIGDGGIFVVGVDDEEEVDGRGFVIARADARKLARVVSKKPVCCTQETRRKVIMHEYPQDNENETTEERPKPSWYDMNSIGKARRYWPAQVNRNRFTPISTVI